MPMTKTYLDVLGPYDLAEVALMDFGHRDERQFDGVMRLAFCLETVLRDACGCRGPPGGAGGSSSRWRPARPQPLERGGAGRVRSQVARVMSLDDDGEAYERLCPATRC